jgi:hypothetical protein
MAGRAPETAKRLAEPLQQGEKLEEAVGVEGAGGRRHGVATLAGLRARADQAEAAQDAVDVAVDDEDAHAQGAGVERCRGDLLADARKALQPGERLVDGTVAQEREVVIGPLATDPGEGGDEIAGLVVGEGDLAQHALDLRGVRGGEVAGMRPAARQAGHGPVGDCVVGAAADQGPGQPPHRRAAPRSDERPEQAGQRLPDEGEIIRREVECVLHNEANISGTNVPG